MLLREFIEPIKENIMPHLYLDMDGVQADFFGAWAKKHNVSHYKAIHDREGAIEKLAHSSAKEVYKFFFDLEPLVGGQQIIKWLRTHDIPFTVLSAPLRGPYAEASIQAKKDWLDKYNLGTSSSAIFTSGKQKYAKNANKANILVDDFGPYLQKWSDAGGIAVKHEDEAEIPNSGELTIAKLKELYKPFL